MSIKICPECQQDNEVSNKVCISCGYPYLETVKPIFSDSNSESDVNPPTPKKTDYVVTFQRYWPVVVVAFLVPLAGLFYFMFTNQDEEEYINTDHVYEQETVSTDIQTETPEPLIEATPDSEQIETEQVRAAIQTWQNVKQQAFLQTDTSQLNSVLTEPALSETAGAVNWWKNNGQYYSLELLELQFESVVLDSQDAATVQVTIQEIKDNSAEGRKKSTYLAEYQLQKIEDTWKIASMRPIKTLSAIQEKSAQSTASSSSPNQEDESNCKNWSFLLETPTVKRGLLQNMVDSREKCEEMRSLFEPSAIQISRECICMGSHWSN